MQNFANTVGFITGGASGIGLGMARALGERGMAVVLADIEAAALATAAEDLAKLGITAHTEVLDVSDAEAYQRVAERTLARHGSIQFLFNNAGVGGGPALADWRWALDVNVMGVVHGVEFFLPAMQTSGETAYIINTSSLAGHLVNPAMPAYCASKFAVVAYTEALRAQLAESAVGVSVLCPAWVKTRIAESHRNHPDLAAAAGRDGVPAAIGRLIEAEGIPVETLVERVLAGMASGTFNLFTHPDFWPALEARLDGIRSDYSEVL
jgi:NADP-dependent 3-hydroxy acid dehydrogenase YdfG